MKIISILFLFVAIYSGDIFAMESNRKQDLSQVTSRMNPQQMEAFEQKINELMWRFENQGDLESKKQIIELINSQLESGSLPNKDSGEGGRKLFDFLKFKLKVLLGFSGDEATAEQDPSNIFERLIAYYEKRMPKPFKEKRLSTFTGTHGKTNELVTLSSNQIIGTQAIGGTYLLGPPYPLSNNRVGPFTFGYKADTLDGQKYENEMFKNDFNHKKLRNATTIQAASETEKMGSKMIKIRLEDMFFKDLVKTGEVLPSVLDMDFDTYFFWWRNDVNFEDKDGKWEKRWVRWGRADLKEGNIWNNWESNNLNDADIKREMDEEYQETKNLAKHLLTINPNYPRKFYLGNWEGDWLLKGGEGSNDEPTDDRIKGMTLWFKVRQKAVDDARIEVGDKTKSSVYHYMEINKVRDGLDENKPRLVNKILPNVNVDYVSISAYDIQNLPGDKIKNMIDHINNTLKPKEHISGRRVFIGECGHSVRARAEGGYTINFNPLEHEIINRDIFIKFLEARVPYILYWEMYNNELSMSIKSNNGKLSAPNQQVGFWLIDNEGYKWPLYDTLNRLYQKQSDLKNSDLEMVSQMTIDFLKNHNPEYNNKNTELKEKYPSDINSGSRKWLLDDKGNNDRYNFSSSMMFDRFKVTK